jgi:acetyl esterase/lipase
MAEDAFAGLTWLHAHATELHVDTSRIGIMGDSGGGCVAAGTALLARDRGLTPALAKQILIYPMLDDRNVTPDTSLLPFMVWSYEDNLTAWAAVLGKPLEALTAGTVGDDQVSPYTAPARLTDAANLPPTFIEVGNLDIFRDEDIEYARKLALANVTTELHVRAGCPHGWEGIAPEAKVTQVSRLDRIKALQSF